MLDIHDQKLLSILQSQANLTNAELGEKLHLSSSQAGRRKQRLEEEGYITHYSAMIDSEAVGLAIQAFIQISMIAHSSRSADSFHTLIQTQPEVVSMWTLTGEADYLMRVYCASLKDLNRLINEVLLPHDSVARVQSQIVMNQMKEDAPLPLG